MDCWEILNLKAGADTRAIKSAYAAKLKHCRPDDDAEAFVALRLAFEQALQEQQIPASHLANHQGDHSSAVHDGDNAAQDVAAHSIQAEALISSLIDRLQKPEQTQASLAWFADEDMFVDLNTRPLLGREILRRLQTSVFSDLDALARLGELFGWMHQSSQESGAEHARIQFDNQSTPYEHLIAQTWIDTEGARIGNTFFQIAKVELDQAAAQLEVEIAHLDARWMVLLESYFAHAICAPVGVTADMSARTILTIENFFHWQTIEGGSPIALKLRMARMQYQISCVTPKVTMATLSPLQRALWRLTFEKRSWRNYFLPVLQHYHMARVIHECSEIGLDPHDFANAGLILFAKRYDALSAMRWRKGLATLGLIAFSACALALCFAAFAIFPIAGFVLVIGASRLFFAMYRDYASMQIPPSVGLTPANSAVAQQQPERPIAVDEQDNWA
jgi:hypothetical protein